MGSHENLRLTEKLRRVIADILDYEFTVNDPTTWTTPWTAMISMKLKDELIYEYACHEGNGAIPICFAGTASRSARRRLARAARNSRRNYADVLFEEAAESPRHSAAASYGQPDLLR